MPQFMKTLNNISRSQSVFRSERLKAEGICSAHHSFILSICLHPGRSQEELSRELCLNKSTACRTINYLEEKGFVRREANPRDKRSFLVFPTDKMLDIFPKVKALAKEWNDSLSEDISEEELKTFYSVLSKMEEKAKALISAGRDFN